MAFPSHQHSGKNCSRKNYFTRQNCYVHKNYTHKNYTHESCAPPASSTCTHTRTAPTPTTTAHARAQVESLMTAECSGPGSTIVSATEKRNFASVTQDFFFHLHSKKMRMKLTFLLGQDRLSSFERAKMFSVYTRVSI